MNWDYSGDPNLVFFLIFRGINGEPGELYRSVKETGFTDFLVKKGDKYTYWMVVQDSFGMKSSESKPMEIIYE